MIINILWAGRMLEVKMGTVHPYGHMAQLCCIQVIPSHTALKFDKMG